MRELKQRKTRGKRSRTRHQVNALRGSMRVSKGDTVRIMRGEDKGKEGKVLRARRWRLTMFTPSTSTRPVFRNTRSTLPSLPLSSPRMTRTVSPFDTCILPRSAFT